MIISTTLIFSNTLYADALAQQSDIVDKLNLDSQEINRDSQKKIKRSERRISKAFDKKIKKAQRKNKSLDQAVLDLTITLEQSYVDALKAKRRLNKKRQLRKVASKLRAFSTKTNVEEFRKSLIDITDRENFEKVKIALIQDLRDSGSEVKFLKNRKSIETQNISITKVGKKNSRAIASNYPSFSEIFTYTAILGLSAYGIITLAAIGSALAITGVVILGIIGFVLLLMGIMCVTGLCYLNKKEEKQIIA
jgi:hypothetical protein